MKYLGIDQSYNCTAWVIINNSGLIEDFGTIKSNKDHDIYTRCNYIINELMDITEKHKVGRIALEGLAFGMQGSATRDLAGLQFVIMLGLRDIDYPLVVSPLHLKKAATGNGKATKDEMISALPESIRLQFEAANYKKSTGLHDLADAYWLAREAMYDCID